MLVPIAIALPTGTPHTAAPAHFLIFPLDEVHDERSWDLMLIMQFESMAALRAYQIHPEHIAAIEFNRPRVANVGSLDFNKT